MGKILIKKKYKVENKTGGRISKFKPTIYFEKGKEDERIGKRGSGRKEEKEGIMT